MTIAKIGVAVVALGMLTATGAFAQSGSFSLDTGPVDLTIDGGAGPEVGGDINSSVDVGDVTAEAEEGSTASNRIGSVTGGDIGGDVNLEVQAGDVSATARENSCAENLIGSVGPAACN